MNYKIEKYTGKFTELEDYEGIILLILRSPSKLILGHKLHYEDVGSMEICKGDIELINYVQFPLEPSFKEFSSRKIITSFREEIQYFLKEKKEPHEKELLSPCSFNCFGAPSEENEIFKITQIPLTDTIELFESY